MIEVPIKNKTIATSPKMRTGDYGVLYISIQDDFLTFSTYFHFFIQLNCKDE